MIKRMTLALAALLLGASMHTAAFAQTPQIRGVSGNWTGDDPRLLKVAPAADGGVLLGSVLIRVDATFARHLWPGRRPSPSRRRCIRSSKRRMARQSLSLGLHGGGRQLVCPVGGFLSSACDQPAAANSACLFRRSAKVRLAARRRIRTVTSLLLRAMAAGVCGFGQSRGSLLPRRGYHCAANSFHGEPEKHGLHNGENRGRRLVRAQVRFGPPDLAMYAPRNQRAVNETRAEYFRRLTDILPDRPYRLAGWAYAQTQRDVRRRPSLRCIPSKHWFVHEAGFHRADGSFLPTPPRPERVRGETRVVVMQDTLTAAALGTSLARPAWHPRIWDLHLWLDPRPECSAPLSCPVLIQIESPSPIVGLRTPRRTFFRSQTFE